MTVGRIALEIAVERAVTLGLRELVVGTREMIHPDEEIAGIGQRLRHHLQDVEFFGRRRKIFLVDAPLRLEHLRQVRIVEDRQPVWLRLENGLECSAKTLDALERQTVDQVNTDGTKALVTRREDPLALGVPKVLDFGIAKIAGAAALGQNLTTDGSLLGTPAYMAPERFRRGPYGPKSDVYSLGTVLYEMLAGRLPFIPSSPDPLALVAMQVEDEPPSLTNRMCFDQPIKRIACGGNRQFPGVTVEFCRQLPLA